LTLLAVLKKVGGAGGRKAVMSIFRGDGVWVAIGMDAEGDLALRLRSAEGTAVWDLETSLAERARFLAEARVEGWETRLEAGLF
jgi:hypothetical protein